MRVNRLADVHRIRAHFDGQRNLTNHVARMRADHAAAQDLAVAVGFWRIIKQQLGDALVVGGALDDVGVKRCAGEFPFVTSRTFSCIIYRT